eukprot:14006-Heterococcus_DN1.PRE.4
MAQLTPFACAASSVSCLWRTCDVAGACEDTYTALSQLANGLTPCFSYAAESRYVLVQRAVARRKLRNLLQYTVFARTDKYHIAATTANTTASHTLQTQEATAAAVQECQYTISSEKAKFARWRAENTRRKHNYIPFAIALLKVLAEKGQLEGLMEKARNKTDEAVAAASKRKAAAAGLSSDDRGSSSSSSSAQ